MPNIIDNRIVEMQFNNKQFEQGVSTSMGTLDKLKNALNFSSSVSNFGEITKAFERFGGNTLSEVAVNVESIADRFSNWGIIGMQVLQNLTNKATEFVGQALKPITDELSKIDVLTNYTQGWSKYADKTTAVQTIMSATTTTWKEDAEAMGEAGTQMEYVSGALDKLNWFSDETSYSFTDMTNNIGKFTAQGVPLSQAVEAMEGISVWAAKSGQSTNEASRAMYNLSQALGVGAVKLMDWKSIENANMATMEFKNTVLETAVAAGTLTASIDKDGSRIYKTLSGMTVGAENFSQTLSEGWFSKDVLLSTLAKYGNATTLLADVSEDYDVTASQFLQAMDYVSSKHWTLEKASEELEIPLEELTKIFQTLNSEEYALGLASFKMAQEAKTFTEAMDATADATSTAWMNVFETIFGNYEEAKKLWTTLANEMWDVFAGPVVDLGEALSIWKDLGGRDDFFDGLLTAWLNIKDIGSTITKTLISTGTINGFSTFGENLAKSSAQFKKNMDLFFQIKWSKVLDTIESITRLFAAGVSVARKFFSVITDAFSGFKLDWDSFDPKSVFKPIEDSLYRIRAVIGNDLGPWLKSTIPNVIGIIRSVLSGVLELSAKIVAKLEPLFKVSLDFVKVFQRNLEGAFGEDLKAFMANVSGFFMAVKTTFDDVLSSDGMSKLGAIVTGIGNVISQVWGAGFDIIRNILKSVTQLVRVFDSLWVELDPDAISELFDSLGGFRSLVNKIVKPALNGIITLVSSVGRLITQLINSGVLKKIVDFIHDIADAASERIGAGLESFFELLAKGVDKITGFIPTVISFFNEHMPKFSEAVKSLFAGFGAIGTLISDVVQRFFGLFESDETEKVSILSTVIGWVASALRWVGDTLQNIAPLISTVFGWIIDKIKSIGPTVVDILHKIGEGFKFIIEKVKELFGNGGGFSLDGIFKVLQGGAISAILFEIFNLFKNGAKSAGGLAEVINGLKDGLGGLIKKTDGPDIKTIALSILMIAGACVLLSAIDPTRLVSVFAGLTAALTEMAAAFALLDNFSGTTMAGKKSPLSNLLDSMSMKNNRNSTGSLMLKMAASLILLAGALKILGDMNWEQIGVGLAAMAGCLTILTLAILILDSVPSSKNAGAGLLPAAFAMIELALALKIFGSMDPDQISKGLGAFTGTLLLLSASLALLAGFGPKVLAGAAALLIGSAAMVVMAGALLALGVVLAALSIFKWDKIAEKLAPLAVVLLAVVGIGTLMGALSPLMLLGAVSVLALGAALTTLAKGLAIYAAALAFLQVSGGIGALAGSLAILAGMSTVLALVSPLLLIASIGMLTFGAALKVLGKGLLIFSLASAAFGMSMDVVLGSVQFVLLGLINLLPSLFVALANGLIQMFVTIANNASLVAETLITIATAILTKLGEIIPVIVNLVFDLVIQLISKLEEAVPKFLDLVFSTLTQIIYGLADFAADAVVAILQLLTDILTSFAEFAPQIVEQAVLVVIGFIEGFLNGLAEGIPRIVQAAWDLVIAFVDGIADGIDGNWDRLMDAFKHLGKSLIKAILGIFVSKDTRDEIVKSGKNIIDGFKSGFTEGFSRVKEAVTNLISNIGKWFSERWQDFKEAGANVINGFIQGISDGISKVGKAVKGIATTAISTVEGWLGISSPSKVFAEIGGFTVEGLALGMKDASGLAEDSAEEIGTNVTNALTLALQNATNVLENDTPVITPIIDMSNVKKSSALLSSMFRDPGLAVITDPIMPIAAMAIQGVNPMSQTAGYGNSIGAVNITINPQPGQNPEEIADEVMTRLNATLLRGKAVWA